jgi:5-methylcytosine-specific restriction endonuclease McrA
MSEVNKEKYYLKIKDPRWSKKREDILIRDKYVCQRCGVMHKFGLHFLEDQSDIDYQSWEEDTTILEVHHINYSGEPWEAKDIDLITLCDHCHDHVEYLKQGGYNMPLAVIKRQERPDDELYAKASIGL